MTSKSPETKKQPASTNKDAWKTRRKHPLKTRKKERFLSVIDFLDADDVVFLDTETTGLSKTDEIVEIAIVNSNGDILMNTLVKPNVPVGPVAQSVHGITKKMLSNAPTWKDVYCDYLQATDGKTILAYNSSFDKRLIQQTCKSNGMVNKNRKWDCLMGVYSEFMGNSTPTGMYKKHKLTVAAYNSDITIRNIEVGEHRALYDTGLSLGVFRYMRQEVGKELN